MSKIYLDENILINHVYGGLENCISNLSSAKELASALSIPSDFNYRTYLRNLDDNIKSDLNTISEIYNKIKGDSAKYNKINDELNSYISSIENYSLSLRQSAIK